MGNSDNRFISANNQRPKHIHAPTARSPFIGSAAMSSSMNAMSMQPFMSSGGGGGRGNVYNPSHTMSTSSGGLYGGNPHVDVMQYPASSSSASSHNKTTPIPHIQSVALSTDHQSSSDNPDNTLNFINDLKEMLKSTDRLLKNKPMNLYGSHAV